MGGREFCEGFALAGIDTVRVTDASVHTVLTQVLARDNLALVILDEQWMDALDEIRPPGVKVTLPIVIPVPGAMLWRDVEKPGEDQYIAALIRQAVGYQLDIQL
jgi:vacuolar-type H+-ATPase subunit F/Vma7